VSGFLRPLTLFRYALVSQKRGASGGPLVTVRPVALWHFIAHPNRSKIRLGMLSLPGGLVASDAASAVIQDALINR